MTSTCGKNKKAAHEAITECVTTFWRPLWSISEQTHGNIESICCIQYKTNNFSFSKSFSITRKPAFAYFGKHEKKPFEVICCLYKMKQSHWLLCITRNCDWSRKITPLSNLIQMASHGMKTHSESRIELQKSTNVKESTGKKLECFLEYCWSWKNTIGKHAVAVNTGRHLVRV